MFETSLRTCGWTLSAVIGAGFIATTMTTSAMALPTGTGQSGLGVVAIGDVQLATYRHHRHHYSHHYRYNHRNFGPRHGFYRPYGYYYSPPVYVRPSGCGWLKVRAMETGSRYWWQRYRNCRH